MKNVRKFLAGALLLGLLCIGTAWIGGSWIKELGFIVREKLSRFESGLDIPQFILDTEHPWLKERSTRALLKSLDNPKDALCSLSSPLRPLSNITDQSTSHYPPDLFKSLLIDNNQAGVSRPGWKNARYRLEEITSCPAALHDVNVFKTVIWINDKLTDLNGEQSTPPKGLPELFVSTLSRMSNLTDLEWNTFSQGNKEFETAFLGAGLRLSSVKNLKPAANTEWWIDICPGVESLEAGHSVSTANYWRWTNHEVDERQKLVDSTAKLENLTSFKMKGEWQTSYLETLSNTAPQLVSLQMYGELDWNERYQEKSKSVVHRWLTILARFKNLKILALPSMEELSFGFDGGAWCGNAYFGASGREYGRQVVRDGIEATEKAADLISEQWPGLNQLERLCVVSSCAEIIRDQVGHVTFKWPWTEKGIEDWVWKQWPEPANHDDL